MNQLLYNINIVIFDVVCAYFKVVFSKKKAYAWDMEICRQISAHVLGCKLGKICFENFWKYFRSVAQKYRMLIFGVS